MSNWKSIAQLTQLDDQDIAHASDWIDSTDPVVLLQFIDALGKSYDNPTTEVMTRFAMIGLSAVVRSRLEADEGATP